jgi:hypothetical protein
LDPEEARTIYEELSRRYSAWVSAALGYIKTSLSAGAANTAASERPGLEASIPSRQKMEQDLKREYQEYKAYAEQWLYDSYGSIVTRVAEALTQHDPLHLVQGSDAAAYGHTDESIQEVPDEDSDMALWIALRLPDATTKQDVERHIREMYGKRLRLTGRRNRSRRLAIASSVWEVWQSVEAQGGRLGEEGQ